MPTAKVFTLGRERTVATLARKVFDIENQPNAAELQRKAEAAILAANPRLAKREGFNTGDRIVVPAVTGLKLADDVSRSTAKGDGLTSEATLRLETAASRMKDAFGRDSEARKEALGRVTDRTFLAEARAALPQSVGFLQKTAERLRAEEEGQKANAERMQKAVSDAMEAVKQIDGIARRITTRR